MIGVAAAIYFATVHPARNSRPLGGPNVDLSPVPGPQTEVSIAVKPSDSRVLLAGSNDGAQPRPRVYTSRDGGATWSATLGPSLPGDECARGEPAVAIDGEGREYYAFIRATITPSTDTGSLCADDLTTSLKVAARGGPTGSWTLTTVAPPAYQYGFDDKPAIAVDTSARSPRRGRVYLVWSRLFSNSYETTVASHSDDHGRSWSPPVAVDRSLATPQLATVAVGPRGELYVGGVDARLGVWITRSLDGGRHFLPARAVAPLPGNIAAQCTVADNVPLSKQASRCTGPNPTVTLLPTRSGATDVVVTYGSFTKRGAQAVYAAVLDGKLRLLARSPRIGLSAKTSANQMWPVAAVDSRAHLVWACYYDTTGSVNRRRAWFTCTASADARSWSAPIRASSQPSVVEAILGDGYSYGGYAGLVAADGVAHPAWPDTRKTGNDEDVYTAAIHVRAVKGHHRAP